MARVPRSAPRLLASSSCPALLTVRRRARAAPEGEAAREAPPRPAAAATAFRPPGPEPRPDPPPPDRPRGGGPTGRIAVGASEMPSPGSPCSPAPCLHPRPVRPLRADRRRPGETRPPFGRAAVCHRVPTIPRAVVDPPRPGSISPTPDARRPTPDARRPTPDAPGIRSPPPPSSGPSGPGVPPSTVTTSWPAPTGPSDLRTKSAATVPARATSPAGDNTVPAARRDRRKKYDRRRAQEEITPGGVISTVVPASAPDSPNTDTSSERGTEPTAAHAPSAIHLFPARFRHRRRRRSEHRTPASQGPTSGHRAEPEIVPPDVRHP